VHRCGLANVIALIHRHSSSPWFIAKIHRHNFPKKTWHHHTWVICLFWKCDF
jgi:hypothetical protein